MSHRTRSYVIVLVVLVLLGAWIGLHELSERGLPAYHPPSVRHPPPPITTEVRLLVTGDWGSRRRSQAEVAWAMERAAAAVEGVHGGLLLGDNFYPHGVEGPEDGAFVEVFEQPYDTEHLGLLTWHVVLGNHDYDGDEEAQIAYTERSGGRWHLPAHYYRVDFPATGAPLLTVLALDTNPLFRERRAMLAWLDRELQALAGAEQWVVVMGHHPFVSYARKPDRVPPYMDGEIRPVMTRHRTPDLYLSGHAHCMEMIEDRGLSLAVIGSGGKTLYDVTDGPGSTFHARAFGFGLLRAARDRLRLEFRDTSDRLLHEWETARGP